MTRCTIMKKFNNDSPGQPEPSQEPVLDSPEELLRWAETKAWLDRINQNMKRMSTDEVYRKEIAKKLS